MWQRPFYHEGMSELQDRFDGRRVAEAIERHRKHYEFWDDEKETDRDLPVLLHRHFLERLFRLQHQVRRSRLREDRRVEHHRISRNMTAIRCTGRSATSREILTSGLLFVRFDGKSRRMRVNGRASILDDAAAKPAFRRATGGADRVRDLSELPALRARSRRRDIVALRPPRRAGATATAGVEAAATTSGTSCLAEIRTARSSRRGVGRLRSGLNPRP